MTAPRMQQTGDIDLQGPGALRDAKTLPPEERARIRRNVAKMEAAKAPREHIEAYLRDTEKLAPQDLNDRLTPIPGNAAPRTLSGLVTGQKDQPARPATTGEQMLTSTARGVVPGFLDEVSGVGAALLTPSSYAGKFGRNYTKARDEIRGIAEQAHEEHPIASRVAEFGGAAATAIPAGIANIGERVAAGPVLKLGARMAQGAKAGAGYGAGYGVVAGAGDADSDLKGRAIGAAQGGVAGGVLGGALGAASPVVGKALTELKDLIGRRQIAAGSKAALDAKNAILSSITDPTERAQVEALIANDPHLGPAFRETPTAPNMPRLRARTGAIGNIGELGGSGSPLRPQGVPPAAPADASRFVATADDRAAEKMLEAAGRDNKTPESIRLAYQQAQKDGNAPLNIMDLSGENMQGLGRAARAAPSTAKNLIPKVLEARGKEAETRVIGKLIETTGQGRRINLTQTIDQMAEERSKDAETLYAPIRDQIVDAPEIADALQMAPMQKAYELARKITTNKAGAAKLRGAGDGKNPLPPYAELFDDTGALKKPLTLGQLDQIKRGLDDMLEKAPRDALDAGGLGNEGMGSLRDLKNAFVSVLDNAVPDYAKARQSFAGHSAMIRAFDTGKSLFTKSPDEMSAALAEMSQAEQDAFRKGAVEALSQRIETVTPGNSLSLRVADKTRDRARLRLLFPDDASYTTFRQSIAQEALAHVTKSKVLGGSNTVDKLAEFADLAGVDLGDMLKGAQSGPGNLLVRGVQKLAGAAKNRSMASKADALAPKLLASGQSLEQVIQNLQAASDRLAGQQANSVTRTSAATAGASTAAHRPPRKKN